jgi:hypothetical protein
MQITGNITPINYFIDGIRNINSLDPSVLPQRSGEKIDDKYEIRLHNKALYEKLKDDYLDNFIFKNHSDIPGIYFFNELNEKNTPRYYYIGISGTRQNQIRTLKERLRKHLLTLDHTFYCIAFPNKCEEYYNDYIKIYASGKYGYMRKTYDRQFSALKKVRYNHITWIGSIDYNYSLLDPIETHFIVNYQPPANFSKRNVVPDNDYVGKYFEANKYLYAELYKMVGDV